MKLFIQIFSFLHRMNINFFLNNSFHSMNSFHRLLNNSSLNNPFDRSLNFSLHNSMHSLWLNNSSLHNSLPWFFYNYPFFDNSSSLELTHEFFFLFRQIRLKERRNVFIHLYLFDFHFFEIRSINEFVLSLDILFEFGLNDFIIII